MTILGIDYGARWLGLSLGNAETKFAFPYQTLEQGSFLFPELKAICSREAVTTIVLGVPTLWHDPQPAEQAIKAFGKRLKQRLGIPVVFVEEAFTSALAQNLALKTARHSTHAQAATLIVENYFQKIPMPKLQ